MKTLDKYLFSQIFKSFIFGLTLIVIAWIAPELLPKVVTQVVSGQQTLLNGTLILLYELPEVIVKSLPMGMLLGSLLAFDKLSKDSEITAMRACGISIYRMVASVILLGILTSSVAFFTNEFIVPPMSLSQEKIQNSGKLISEHFTYVDKNENNIIKQVILIDKFDGNTVNNIRIINFNTLLSGKPFVEKIVAASTAKWNNNKWALTKGISFKLSSDGIYEDTVYFDHEHEKSSNNAYKLLQLSLKEAKHMNISEIREYIKALIMSQHNDEARYYNVRLHQKFSQPIAAVILGVIGLILGLHPPRSSRFVGYTVGMAVILAYYWFWPVSLALGNIGAIPPILAAWLPNILAVLIGIATLKYKMF